MRDIYIALIYLSFLVIGMSAPFVATLGYVWVDNFYPQFISALVGQIPASLVMAVAAVSTYILADRRSPPSFTAHFALNLMFAAWCCLTLFWADAPAAAMIKWDWAFKVVAIAAFLPFVIRSRVQIEAFLLVFMFSAMLHMLPLGIKTLISGSSYGRYLGIITGNSGLSESSYLSAASIGMIPIVLYLRSHSILIPKSKIRDIGALALVCICVLSAIGTYARTALIGFAVVGVFMWLQSRRKVLFTIGALAVAGAFSGMIMQTWNERLSTIEDYSQEDSALGRILVWKWTLGYVMEHPLGGGFNAYYLNRIEFPAVNGAPPTVQFGKAYHNIFFEVLGEQGFPGLAMYVSMLILSLLYMVRVRRQTRGQPHQLWCFDLAAALTTSLLTLMACGNFIGIGFQPMIWYMMVLPVALREYVRRVQRLEEGAQRPGTVLGGLRAGQIGQLGAVAGPVRLPTPKLAR